MQVLTFTSAKQLYCCDLDCVLRVIKILQLKAVPGMPNYFKGLMDYYGTQVSVIDLLEYLDETIELKYSLETPIIMLHHDAKMLGLIVEEVLGVYDIEHSDLQALPEITAKKQLQGTIHIGNDSALMLEVPQLMCLSDIGEGVAGGSHS
ncbi:MAG: chemotaxis protein CheW [Coxiellaceae bacterium]|nr:chemotaxis protein CheW [Coxiellaceae bacterium]